ncbi:MAG: MmgE/PrpD family protein, partial [Alphaproteobacteria bacterium]|nr:MmgE/PrpD family protein [Alphaproteobacteria bacterium]
MRNHASIALAKLSTTPRARRRARAVFRHPRRDASLPRAFPRPRMDAEMTRTEPAASLTQALGAFAVALEPGAIPAEVRARARLCLLDFAGVTLAGAREPAMHPLAGLVLDNGGAGEATTWGFGARAPAAMAALANGSVGHHLELDDGHILGHVHPGATVIPAAFALAEARRAPGAALVAAIVAGYEVLVRVGRGIATSAMYDRGYHGPGLFGAFG